jgi:hypothetical protein
LIEGSGAGSGSVQISYGSGSRKPKTYRSYGSGSGALTITIISKYIGLVEPQILEVRVHNKLAQEPIIRKTEEL